MKVLFMCPHNAAKSVLAEAYARELSEKRGLTDLRISTTGTEPSMENSPHVLKLLSERGLPLPADGPSLVQKSDLDDADLVVSFGCDFNGFEIDEAKLLEWTGVPDTDLDLEGSAREIETRVRELLAGLT